MRGNAMNYKPKVRETQLLVQELPDEILVYDLVRNEAHCLNGSAARIWALCNGERTTGEIGRIVAPDLAPDRAESLVWCAIDQFAERHLLEEPVHLPLGMEPEPADTPAGMTRRGMLISLGIVVGMIPIVDSIVSPPAALAVSMLSTCSGSTQMGGSTPCM